MPKMKSVKSATKRFKVKSSGAIKRGSAYKSHILTKKNAKRIRNLNAPKYINKADKQSVINMIS